MSEDKLSSATVEPTKGAENTAGEWPSVDCICLPPGGCQCGPEERVLRAYIGLPEMPAMNDWQREWCLKEIERVEGYRRDEYSGLPDSDLSRGVINAWTDYARDKGLL